MKVVIAENLSALHSEDTLRERTLIMPLARAASFHGVVGTLPFRNTNTSINTVEATD